MLVPPEPGVSLQETGVYLHSMAHDPIQVNRLLVYPERAPLAPAAAAAAAAAGCRSGTLAC